MSSVGTTHFVATEFIPLDNEEKFYQSDFNPLIRNGFENRNND